LECAVRKDESPTLGASSKNIQPSNSSNFQNGTRCRADRIRTLKPQGSEGRGVNLIMWGVYQFKDRFPRGGNWGQGVPRKGVKGTQESTKKVLEK